MKKITCVFGFILLLLFFSCKSDPETSLTEMPEDATVSMMEPSFEEIPEETIPPAEPSSSEDEAASIIVPAEEPESANYENDLLEPMDPEMDVLPEISEPMIEPPSVALPPDETTEPQSVSQEDEISDSETSTETSSLPSEEASEEKPLPPSPPAHLRPAEPINDTAVVREAVPVPVNPIPELPAQPLSSIGDDSIVFSRTVRAVVGQIIEIPFRGTGWVFLGELGSRRGIAYDSRRLDPEGQSFIFLAEQSGTYILKFYKEDYVRDYILNDHVQVIIEEAPESTGTGWFNPPSNRSRIIAEPRWPLDAGNVIVPEDDSSTIQKNESPDAISSLTDIPILDEGVDSVFPALPSSVSTVTPSPETKTDDSDLVLPDDAPPEDYFQKAQEEFDAGRIAGAISILEQFRLRYPSGSDEAFWLLGQFYEANSPSRAIRTSLDYYHRLIDEYPQSRRYAAATARIAYLERYYLNIR